VTPELTPFEVVESEEAARFRILVTRMERIEAQLDEVIQFVTALKQGMGNAQNSGGPMAMMARAMLPDFSQG
jgi:hypothetical protein